MIQTKAVVQLVSEVESTGYSLTLYMGIQSDSGPDEIQLLTSPNDLYRYFNTYSESPSYRMAEFCLLRGYKVYAQRVSQVTGPSSCRKFIDGNNTYFYSPRVGKDYSEPMKSPFLPYTNSSEAVYSQILTFNPETYSSILPVDPNFILIVPKTIYGNGTHNIHNIPLMGSGWSLDASDENYILRYYNVDVNVGLQPAGLTGTNFKNIVLSFLERNCNMTVESMDEEGSIVEDENGNKTYNGDRFLILSSSDISDFYLVNPTFSDGTVLLEIQTSDIGRNDNYCRYLDDKKVCTIYSKQYSALDDTEVTIDLSDGYYYVNVYRYDVNGTPIMSEVFQYTQKNNDILNLSLDSQLVEIEVYDEDANLSGTYRLRGQEVFYSDDDFLNSLEGAEYGSTELQVDVCVDNNESPISPNRTIYLNSMRRVFPNSVIISDYNSPDGSQDLHVQIGPSVTWLDTGYTMKGLTYLLDLLPLEDKGAEVYRVRVEEDGASYFNQIEERDYGIVLIGTRTRMSNILPIKSVISVIAMENYITNNSRVSSVASFRSLVEEAKSTVNSYLSTSTSISINNIQIRNRRLTADLSFTTDTYIIYNFKVTATLLW